MTTTELKHFDFVEGTAKSLLGFGEQTYCLLRGWVPSLFISPVQYTENVVAPYYGKAQTLCHKVLVVIDGKVDYTVIASQNILKSGVAKTRSVVGEDAAEQFQEAKAKYVAVVSDGYQFVFKNGLAGTAKAAINRRGEAVERVKSIVVTTTKFVVSAAQSTAEYVANQPAVQSAVHHAKPYADFAHSKYSCFHSALVHNPQYASLYKFITNTSDKILLNKYVKGSVGKSKEIVYPYIQFVADPTLTKVTPYVEALKDHLKPATAPAEKSELPPSQQLGNSSNIQKSPPAANPPQPKKAE